MERKEGGKEDMEEIGSRIWKDWHWFQRTVYFSEEVSCIIQLKEEKKYGKLTFKFKLCPSHILFFLLFPLRMKISSGRRV